MPVRLGPRVATFDFRLPAETSVRVARNASPARTSRVGWGLAKTDFIRLPFSRERLLRVYWRWPSPRRTFRQFRPAPERFLLDRPGRGRHHRSRRRRNYGTRDEAQRRSEKEARYRVRHVRPRP